jgi:hypothetical protein
MVSVAQIVEAWPAAWRDAAGGWRALARALAERADTVDALRRRLATDWRGPAAAAALAALAALAAVSVALRALPGFATYRRWIIQAGLLIESEEVMPEDDSGHQLFWPRRPR